MIQLSPQMRIFLFVEPVDFRNGIDGLAGLCRSRLRQDPMSGAVFLFRNRRRNGLKLLVYDGPGILAVPQAPVPWNDQVLAPGG